MAESRRVWSWMRSHRRISASFFRAIVRNRLSRRTALSGEFPLISSYGRMSRYEIRDPFLRFHFQYVYPHADLVEQKRLSRLGEIVRTNFDSYVGHTAYEELT